MDKLIMAAGVLLMAAQMQIYAGETISLAGKWGVKLDAADVGIKEGWQSRDFLESIKLPGSLPENGYGDNPGVDSPWTGGIVHQEWNKP